MSQRIRQKNNAAIVWKVGQRIRALREEENITQETLAYSVDMSKGTLNLIERGYSDPQLTTLERIAQGLNIGLPELLDVDGGYVKKNEPKPLYD